MEIRINFILDQSNIFAEVHPELGAPHFAHVANLHGSILAAGPQIRDLIDAIARCEWPLWPTAGTRFPIFRGNRLRIEVDEDPGQIVMILHKSKPGGSVEPTSEHITIAPRYAPCTLLNLGNQIEAILSSGDFDTSRTERRCMNVPPSNNPLDEFGSAIYRAYDRLLSENELPADPERSRFKKVTRDAQYQRRFQDLMREEYGKIREAAR